MKQTITPERLLGEYIGTLRGICAWDIPQQLREKLERRVRELNELQIEMEVQHRFKENSDKQIEDAIKKWQSEPQELKFVPDVDKYIDTEGWEVFGQKAFEYANKLKRDELTKLAIELGFLEDVFDITTMD